MTLFTAFANALSRNKRQQARSKRGKPYTPRNTEQESVLENKVSEDMGGLDSSAPEQRHSAGQGGCSSGAYSEDDKHSSGWYNPLDPSKNQIRLLVLRPSEDDEAQIHCHLRHVSLDGNPEFEALSYAWGDPSRPKSIRLHEQDFGVTLSAWSALKALRYTSRDRVLWIDAICINQEDREEREAQVQLMGAIYRKALGVRVWLGPSEPNDKDAIMALEMLANGATAYFLEHWGLRHKEREMAMDLLKAPWWSRLWVVQEVGLGQDVVFQKGASDIRFDTLLTAYQNSASFLNEHFKGFVDGWFDGSQYDFLRLFSKIKTLGLVRELCGLDLDRDGKDTLKEATMNWSTVANLLRVGYKASLDHDRLYALYGLLPHSVILRPAMAPSYTSSVEQVFTDVTYSIMEASQCLMMQGFLDSRSTERAPELPSWVPDWRLIPGNRHEANLRVARERQYDASLGSEFYIRRLSSDTICVKGICVGFIAGYYSAGIVPTASPILDAIYKEWRKAFAPPIRAPDQSFWKTMLWDCAPTDDGAGLKPLTPSELAAMMAAHKHAVAVGNGEEPYSQGQSAEDARRVNYMINCARNRAVFVTEFFHVGMAPENVEIGDRIFIVSGNSHPVILRPSNRYADTWNTVGECYLQDFMYGTGVANAEFFKHPDQLEYSRNALQLRDFQDYTSLKCSGREINPLWDDIKAPADGLWDWILIE